MLNSHPAAVAYSELLLEGARGKPKWGGEKDLEFWNDFYDFEHQEQPDASQTELLFEYLERVFAPRSGCLAVGFKLMYGQFGAYHDLYEYISSKDVTIVHLIRENALDIVLSKETAVQRGVFHSRDKESTSAIKVRLPVDQLITQLVAQRRAVERAKETFRGGGLRYMEISYEHLLADEMNFQSILCFLGLPLVSAGLGSPLRKLNLASHRELIENYDAVAELLRGTSFEELLR